MYYKSNKLVQIVQQFDIDFSDALYRAIYEAIRKGANRAVGQIIDNPGEYDFRNAKPVRINSLIKQEFIKAYSEDFTLKSRLNWYKSHGVDYFLVDGKYLICFKKIDAKGRVSGYYSSRFKSILNGQEKVPYSKDMLEQLALLGLNKPLPILFVGHTLDKSGLVLADVKCVNYVDGDVNFIVSLKDIFTPNLFNQANDEVSNEWEPKLRQDKQISK